jgi:hypothetical protein
MTYGMPEACAIRIFLARGNAILKMIVPSNNTATQADSENMIVDEFENRERSEAVCAWYAL